MGRALQDVNRVPTQIGLSNSDGTTPIELWVDPTTHRLLVTNTLTGNPLLTSAPLNGQVKIAVTGTAVQLPSNTLVNGVIISAKTGNAASTTVGGSTVTNVVDGTGNGYILAAGASVSFAVDNTNRIWVNGTINDVISFGGS